MRYSLPQQLLRSANLHPHKTALIFAGQEMNWQQMLERTRRLAAHLQAMGIGGGDRVAVLALNSADYVCLYFALPWLGAILVPINTRLGVREMQQWLDNVQATALLHDEAYASIAGELSTQNPDLSLLPIAAIADDPTASAIEPVDADDYPDAMIFHTGGTTGVAKGVVLQQEALLVNSMQWCVATGCNASDTFLISPPMFHLVAGMNTIASAMLGATLVVLPRFETALVLDSIARYGVSKAAMVPAMLEMLFADPDFANADLRALKKISYGGAAISPDLLRRSLTHLPGIQFYQIYGQQSAAEPSVVWVPSITH